MNPLDPRILSIQQPFAWAIVTRRKKVENRDWSTRYRGPILIHASQRLYPKAIEWIREEFGIRVPDTLDRGAIVGVATLVDVITKDKAKEFGGWFVGPYGLVLANAVQLPRPISLKGQLGLYSAPRVLTSRVYRQLSESG